MSQKYYILKASALNHRESTMSKVEEIKEAIAALPEEEYILLRKWFSEKDWQQWDLQIKKDSESKKLDFLLKEALEAKAKGNLREL
jgi:hypothetical protein